MKCQHCGGDAVLLFKCPFCEGYFCREHRLPENHACPEEARIRRQGAPPIPYEYTGPPTREMALPRRLALGFSTTEVRHLAIGAVMVMGVGVSVFWFTGWGLRPGILGSLLAAFTSAFLLHELAHKLAAQLHGLWAEFRLTRFGVFVTLFSILSPFKFVSPGAVVVEAAESPEVLGEISLAGPATNLLLALGFLGAARLFPGGPVAGVSVVGGFFNALIALFNLLPIGPLDGHGVLGWSRAVWGLAFAPAVAASAYSLVLYLGLLTAAA